MDLVDKQESRHHKRSKHSKHSKHSRHSHRKSKHRHRKHHRRHHKKSHGKHHRHRAKLRIDEQALQSALESLEVDALDSIRMEVNKDLHSEAVELLVCGSGSAEEKEVGGGEGESEDSDSSSSESDPEGEITQTKSEDRIVNCDGSTVGQTTTPAVNAKTEFSGLVQEVESTLSAPLTDETLPENHAEDRMHSESDTRDRESEEEDKVPSSKVFSDLKLKKRTVRTIQINIQRKSLVSDAKETESCDSGSPKEEDGETLTVTTGDAKVTYVNLKRTDGLISDSQLDNGDGVPFQGDEKSGSNLEGEFSSASEESYREKGRQKSRDHSSKKRHRSKSSTPRSFSRHRHRHRHSKSMSQSRSPRRSRRHRRSQSRSRSRSPQRSYKHRRSGSQSQSSSPQRSHRHRRSRSWSRSRSLQRLHRHRRSRSRSQSRSPQRSHRHRRSRSRSQSRSPQRSHRHRRSRSWSQSRSPQRSHRHKRSQSRSQSRSPQRSQRHRKSRSQSRSRSPQRSHRHRRSRSRSQSRSPQRSHRHRRSRSQSPSRSSRRSHRKGRSGSRSRSCSPQKSHRHGRSRSSSRHRFHHSRDSYSVHHSRRGYTHYYSPKRYHSPRRSFRRRSYHRSRSRSRSRSRHRRKYHSRTRSSSRESSYSRSSKSSSHSRSQSPASSRGREKTVSTTASSSAVPGTGTVANVSGAGTSDPKQAHIAQLTALCKQLQEKQATEDKLPQEERKAMEESGDTEEVQIRAPFNVTPTPGYQPGLIFHNNVWKTPTQLVAESNAGSDSHSVETQFPVSSGLDHQITEGAANDAQTAAQSINVFARFQSVSVGDLVVKRLEATRKLQENPNDFTAQQTLAYIEQKAKVWAESHMKPGQFTGQRALTALSRQDHKMGMQAWAKKKMFHGLAPVMSSFGMKMLKKMGWQEGQPLGKKGEGHVEPIALDVKVDRSGLSTEMDKQPQIVMAAALQSTNSRSSHLVHGKHPVSVLQEICAKKRWDPPHYELLELGGPAHKKSFLYKITVPLGTFQPAVGSPSKKQAKAQAATACLQGLGFSIDSPIAYTAS